MISPPHDREPGRELRSCEDDFGRFVSVAVGGVYDNLDRECTRPDNIVYDSFGPDDFSHRKAGGLGPVENRISDDI